MIQYIKKHIRQHILRPLWNSLGYFNYFNQKVFFPKNSIIFKRAIKEGIYEHENLTIIQKFIKPNSTMLDIGANIGLMALPILKMEKGIRVISIEPSPNTFPYLIKTHDLSNVKSNWQVLNEAVSNKVGEIDFQLTSPENGAYESILDTKRSQFISTVKVKCKTIDHIWNQNGKPYISFIKIDIEGADLLALKGGEDCIFECKPIILMEWNKTNIIPFKLTNQDLIAFAKQINYNIYALPYFSKCKTTTELNIFTNIDENFLLIPSGLE